eukprot:gnl/Spiro4/1358_TR726_c0_g1_i1.p1 gnl/Spiro4/1358_TR726_c0_g1~~gnl/Spiro4/1358_TR726_c0_g1_i1.p1  ORF type:complete len:468 (+),score=50.15 gnl/Spiro4/1358_TR726_c0_g1_i1:195-1598(+)
MDVRGNAKAEMLAQISIPDSFWTQQFYIQHSVNVRSYSYKSSPPEDPSPALSFIPLVLKQLADERLECQISSMLLGCLMPTGFSDHDSYLQATTTHGCQQDTHLVSSQLSADNIWLVNQLLAPTPTPSAFSSTSASVFHSGPTPHSPPCSAAAPARPHHPATAAVLGPGASGSLGSLQQEWLSILSRLFPAHGDAHLIKDLLKRFDLRCAIAVLAARVPERQRCTTRFHSRDDSYQQTSLVLHSSASTPALDQDSDFRKIFARALRETVEGEIRRYIPSPEIFLRVLRGAVKVVAVRELCDREQALAFERKWVALQKKYPGHDVLPSILFHGTSDGNMDLIVKHGLKLPDGVRVKHATDTGLWGCGTYFSPSPEMALSYCRGGSRLLVCAVLLGRLFTCNNRIDGSSLVPGYDSHADPFRTELVTFDCDQVLPCYVVRVKEKWHNADADARGSSSAQLPLQFVEGKF